MNSPQNQSNSIGESLTQHAWRKLRRNRIAMASLAVLIIVAVLATATPLLPLQPPDQDRTSLLYTSPTASPFWLNEFQLDKDLISHTPELVEKLESELAKLHQRLDAVRQQPQAELQKDLAELQKKLEDDLYRKENEITDTIQRPYRQLGFPELGPVSRWMVRTRGALFGTRSLNSICGRDKLGRDLLSRLFWGARISLIVGIVATFVSLVIGVTYGAVSGYFGGWIDNAMMRAVDIGYSIPFIFVVIFLITILGQEDVARKLGHLGISRITIFFVVVGAIYWLTMARVVRGQVISLKTEPFIEAARSLGAGQWRIIFRHLLPNLFSVVIVYLSLTVPRVMLFEAFLSFLGLGVEPPDVSWGLLANEGIKVITPVKIYWWLILFPSLALGATLLALNFLGDGLRDALDPRLRDE